MELSATASNYPEYSGDIKYKATHKVTPKKSENYTASGSFSFAFTSFLKKIPWQADVTDCSGKIGKDSK